MTGIEPLKWKLCLAGNVKTSRNKGNFSLLRLRTWQVSCTKQSQSDLYGRSPVKSGGGAIVNSVHASLPTESAWTCDPSLFPGTV